LVASESFWRLRGVDLERHGLHERGLVGMVVGELVDREHVDVLQEDVRKALALVEAAREQDVDALSRKDETGDAVDVVDPHGDGLHVRGDQRREGRALSGARDLGPQERLVLDDGRERDAARSCRRAPLRSSRRHPWAPCRPGQATFAQVLLGHLGPEAER
jgi:hypothetical protein